MPLPLIPIIAALTAGGSLVPHAAGGFIVISSVGSYVAGTYIGTAAIASLLAATTTLTAGVAIASGAATAIIGGAGIFGTTIGATGITGALMSAGILSSTPIILPVLGGSILVGCGYASYRLFKLKTKIESGNAGEEMHFSESDAKFIEGILKRISKNEPS